MIGTEFGRLVATGAGIFAFVFLMSYLRLRRQATKSASAKHNVFGAPVPGRLR